MDDVIELARRNLESAGIKPNEQDLQRMERYLQRRPALLSPALDSEPWSLPRTERWRHA